MAAIVTVNNHYDTFFDESEQKYGIIYTQCDDDTSNTDLISDDRVTNSDSDIGSDSGVSGNSSDGESRCNYHTDKIAPLYDDGIIEDTLQVSKIEINDKRNTIMDLLSCKTTLNMTIKFYRYSGILVILPSTSSKFGIVTFKQNDRYNSRYVTGTLMRYTGSSRNIRCCLKLHELMNYVMSVDIYHADTKKPILSLLNSRITCSWPPCLKYCKILCFKSDNVM